MRMTKVKLNNFRGYCDEIEVDFCNLTAFVGKNDSGKSSVLEALDVFFNDSKGVTRLDKDDINKQATLQGDSEITISVCFDDLPENVVIDSTNETNLRAEYLVNCLGQLEVIKKYVKAGKAKVYLKAYHPTNPSCAELLQKKDSELRKIIEQENLQCGDKTKNATMRKSIWDHYKDNLQLAEIELDVTKGDTKSIWDKLSSYLPTFSLFQSDRKNSDGDDEVQDPLKAAVKEILSQEDLLHTLTEVASVVEAKLREVSNRTLDKLNEMSPEVASSLEPVIPTAESLKWFDVFKNVSISGDEGIPINKRGSGVKRLILLNFFRAEAERRKLESNSSSIIYAIEEPETSQHVANQKRLTKALLELAVAPNTQVIITTHSSNIVKQLDFGNLRLVDIHEGSRTITSIQPGQLPYPSLNEVNFVAFGDLSEEYHNELYGFIEADQHLEAYRAGKPFMKYIRLLRNGNQREEQIILSEYIRHQIHHPENTCNPRYTEQQLKESIVLMRQFIRSLAP